MKRTKLTRNALSHSKTLRAAPPGRRPRAVKGRKRRSIKGITLQQRTQWLRSHNIYRQRVNVNNPSLIEGGKLVSDWKERLHAAGIISTDWDMVADTLRDYEKFPDTATSKRLRSYKKPVTLANITNIIFTNYVSNLLINMDLNLDAVADKIGVDVDQLTNINNWDREMYKGKKLNKPGTIFTNPSNGKKWKFVWNYNEGADFYEI